MIALLRMVSGLVLWAAAFALLYALHGLACASDWSGVGPFGFAHTRAALLAAWGALLLAHFGLLAWLNRRRATRLDQIGRAIGLIGLIATGVTGLPILAISSCI